MIKNEKAYERPLAFPFLTLRPSFLSLFACRHDGAGSSRVPFTLPSRHEPAHPRSGHFVPVPRFLHPYRSLCVSLTPCPPDPTPVTVTALLPSGSRSCRRFTLGIACLLLPAARYSHLTPTGFAVPAPHDPRHSRRVPPHASGSPVPAAFAPRRNRPGVSSLRSVGSRYAHPSFRSASEPPAGRRQRDTGRSLRSLYASDSRPPASLRSLPTPSAPHPARYAPRASVSPLVSPVLSRPS